MDSAPKITILLFLISNFKLSMADYGLTTVLGENFENKINEFTKYTTKWLEEFNDKHIGNSEIGRLISYDFLKPKYGSVQAEGKNKKMSLALIPLVFHVGVASTWMLVTSLMAVKSVALGIALLVFKIAVSSAKVASFFTTLKSKHGDNHQDWSWVPPHYEHHGHSRTLRDIGSHPPSEWSSYSPESHSVSHPYKTISAYRSPGDVDYSGDHKGPDLRH